MQETSSTYRRILADENHWFETTVVIGDSGVLITENKEKVFFGVGDQQTFIVVARSGAESGYGEDQIFSVRTNIQLFQNDPSVGGAVSQEIELTMLQPAGDIPQMGLIIPYVRACNAEEKSEWIQQGVFYIDTREISNNDGGITTITLHGYDAMLKAEQEWHDTGTLNWSNDTVSDADMVADIASIMGISVDARTWAIMTDNYQIPMPLNYTLREILGYIASMYVGIFIINEVGQLRLVSLLELPEETNLLIDNIGDYITFGEEPHEVCRIKV